MWKSVESMKSSLTSTSKPEKASVICRTKVLADRMLSDPDRPWCIVEMASLLEELASLVDDIYDRCSGAAAEARLNSLEMRYSELLYSLSS